MPPTWPVVGTGLLLALLTLLLSACAPAAGPQETASQFWRALIAGESDRLAKLVRDSDRALLDSNPNVLPLRAFELGRMVIDGERVEIATRVDLAGDPPMSLNIATVLVPVGDGWRVDYESSVRDISRDSELAKMLAQLQRLGARVGADLNRSLEELQNALPKLESELSKIEKDIRAQVPELRKRLEDFAKGLREPRPQMPQPPDDRKAI